MNNVTAGSYPLDSRLLVSDSRCHTKSHADSHYSHKRVKRKQLVQNFLSEKFSAPNTQ